MLGGHHHPHSLRNLGVVDYTIILASVVVDYTILASVHDSTEQ